MKIAIAGKGGTGKSFIAASLAKLYASHANPENQVSRGNSHLVDKANIENTLNQPDVYSRHTHSENQASSHAYQVDKMHDFHTHSENQVSRGNSHLVDKANSSHAYQVDKIHDFHTHSENQVSRGNSHLVDKANIENTLNQPDVYSRHTHSENQVSRGNSHLVDKANSSHAYQVDKMHDFHTHSENQVSRGNSHLVDRANSAHTHPAFKVYALDADPLGGLGAALGLSQAEIDKVKPIIDMREFIEPGKDDGALYLSAPDITDASGQYSTLVHDVNFLKMAYIKKAGTECYCPEYSFLQALIKSMLLADNDILILDMSAGIEHLTRGTIKSADIMLIVSEATRACIDATKTIRALGEELGIPRIYIVANKIHNEKEELLIRASFRRGELIGLIHQSETVAERAIGVGIDRETHPNKPDKPGADIEELFRNLQSIALPKFPLPPIRSSSPNKFIID